MSEKSTPVTESLITYVAERTTREDPFLGELRETAASEGLPRIWISPEQASFMQMMLRATQARQVVEVGTLGGYSAIWMARALPAEGRIRTIEVNPKHADFAERWIAKSDVAGKIEVIRGAAADVLPTLGKASADTLFLDADRDNYRRYLPELLRIVRPGGVLMVDNAFAGGRIDDESFEEGTTPEMRAFNDRVARTPELQGLIVPIGDGLWVAVRK